MLPAHGFVLVIHRTRLSNRSTSSMVLDACFMNHASADLERVGGIMEKSSPTGHTNKGLMSRATDTVLIV